jgi:hypothetical protein
MPNDPSVPAYRLHDDPTTNYTQAQREQQVRDYINQTLGDYSSLQPFAGSQADMAGQGRQVQMSALGQYGGLIGNGWDPQSREAQRQATNRASESSAGNLGSQMLQAQMGGTKTGSGTSADLASRAAQAQGGAQAANTTGRMGQSAALARRLHALGAYGSLAGAIRGGDISSGEQGFQNQLQQIGGESAARNSLANFYTNQLNQSAAQNSATAQNALGAAGLGLGGYATYQNMANRNPYDVGLSTDYGAGSLLPAASTNYTPTNFPNYWNTP